MTASHMIRPTQPQTKAQLCSFSLTAVLLLSLLSQQSGFKLTEGIKSSSLTPSVTATLAETRPHLHLISEWFGPGYDDWLMTSSEFIVPKRSQTASTFTRPHPTAKVDLTRTIAAKRTEDKFVELLERIQGKLDPTLLSRALSHVRQSLSEAGTDTRLLETVVKNFLIPNSGRPSKAFLTSSQPSPAHASTVPATLIDSGTPVHAPALSHPSLPVIVHDGLFGEALALQAMEQIRSQFVDKLFRPGVFGKFGVDPRIRGDSFAYITSHHNDPNHLKLERLSHVSGTSPLGTILRGILSMAQSTLLPGEVHHKLLCPSNDHTYCKTPFSINHVESMVTTYPRNGSLHTLHSDDLYVGSFGTHPRIFTLIYYLTAPRDTDVAGRLRVRAYQGKDHTHNYDIPPRLDRLVVFPSHPVLHEVLPNYAERFAITIWLHA